MPHEESRRLAERWLRNAKADLAFAGVPLPEGGMLEQLCFHAQQAVEKALKSVLISRGIDPPYSHSIQTLIDQMPSDVHFPERLLDAVELTPYAVMTRYPGEMEPVLPEDYARALDLTRDVVAWAASLIQPL